VLVISKFREFPSPYTGESTGRGKTLVDVDGWLKCSTRRHASIERGGQKLVRIGPS
jgi:hypothetical protein